MKTPLLFLVVLSALFAAGCRTATDPVVPVVNQSLSHDFTSLSGASSWVTGSEDSLTQTRNLRVSLQLPGVGKSRIYLLYTNIAPDRGVRLLGGATVGAQRQVTSDLPVATKSVLPASFRRIELSSLHSMALKSSPAGARAMMSQVAAGNFAVGSKDTFVDSLASQPTVANQHPMTIRATRSDPSVGRTLFVWVVDDCWVTDTSGGGTTNKVNQAMVDALATKFLNPGTSPDIFSLVTGIVGKEWADSGVAPVQHNQTFIDGGAQLHIVVGDLNPKHDYSQGRLMGYFDGSNNQVGVGLNEKVMFAVDAQSLGDLDPDGYSSTPIPPGTVWSLDAYYPNEIVSTLAHEFQHMIHFYQRVVVSGSGEMDTWINEMMSMAIEDLVADQLGTIGPRGLPGASFAATNPELDTSGNPKPIWNGRLPLFNGTHEQVPLMDWPAWDSSDSPLPNYSNAYAFGAWLTRNYGGPAFWKTLMQEPSGGIDAVVAAVNAHGGKGETYSSVARNWGLAVLYGWSSTSPIAYSSSASDGGFTFPGSYKVGSIDLGNYPMVYNSAGDYFSAKDSTVPYLGPSRFSRWPNTSDKVAAGATWFSLVDVASGPWSATLVLPPYIVATVLVDAPAP